MKRTPLFFAGMVALAAMLAGPCAAMSVVAPTFPKLVQSADQIVRAEASAVTSRWDAGAQGQVIHTYVQFRVLKTLKGVQQDSITLRFLGGQVGGTGMVIPDMPTFVVGSTYILFIAQNGEAFCPLVGIAHGSYQVVTDDATGSQKIARADGAPLRSAADVIQPIEPSARSTQSLASALTQDEFENAIIGELHEPAQK